MVSGDVDGVFTPLRPKVSKLQFAHALLPVMEAKTLSAMGGTGYLPQLAQAISDVYRLAQSQPRGVYALRSSTS